ncbi:LysR family transcriptional regulator [Peribacillus butanolivorans]|uniref:LysR family transcriptional regulator n=1 Tax=Peribacillus butanolivorans TaxID=421767 RepID=UPI00167FCC34|nr:LysR family transcriptional regulator [Peribacillus butanolivorans]QNU04738.1 LysR family transcriptional regulator [Peribacillus butanolivorans]
MHLEQLKYIVEVAKTRSISIAAQNLHVSQSTISKAITNLEQELSIHLFTRSRLGAQPTTEGKNIIKKAYEIVVKIEEIQEEAQEQTSLINGELNISASPSFFMPILLKALANFKKDYPNFRIVMTETKSPNIIEDVSQGKIDIGLAMLDEIDWNAHEELVFESLLEGKIMVCVSKHSPLAFSDHITPEELINETVVMYDGVIWKDSISIFMNRYGPMNILFASNNTEVIKKAVSEGLAISFLMDIALKDDHYVKSGEIIPISLINFESNHRSFGWVRSKKKHFSLAAREFLKYLKLHISKLE